MSNVTIEVGDIFESGAQTLTNTVNTVGVMGKGIALQARKRFPDMYDDYVLRCRRGDVKLGEPYLYRTLVPPWILNFPTKGHWRSLSRIDDIRGGLEYVERHHHEWGIESLAVPPLGCGEGGLEWRVVGRVLYQGLTRLTVPVTLYAPYGVSSKELRPEFLGTTPTSEAAPAPRIPVGGVALAWILERITSQRHHYPIGRVSMQKIAYFATRAGIHTALEFEKGAYGPFAVGMKRLLSQLINNGLVEEHKRGRMFVAEPGPALEGAKASFSTELEKWESEMDQVADLFLRLSSGRRAELAASAHYVAEALQHRNRAHGGQPVLESEVISAVAKWKKDRVAPSSEDEIISVVRTLAYLGWIDVRPSYEESELLGA